MNTAPTKRRTSPKDLRASVIVPVRNGGHWLPILIQALAQQTLPREEFEVIVGDDGSDDDPARFETGDRWLRVVSAPPKNSYAARNRAAQHARGRVLAFCDADCAPEPSWLEKGLARLEGADLVAGRIRFSLPAHPTTWTFIDMETSKNHRLLVRLGLAETANLFMRKELFEELGGFDSSIDEHGDFDFTERALSAGYQLAYADDAVVWHPTRDTARAVLRAHWIYSRGYADRTAARGETPEGLKVRNWIPIAWVVRSRRRFGFSLLGPDEAWLAENGVRPTIGQKLKALPAIYILLPYVRNLAQLQGWRDARKRRKAAQRIDCLSRRARI
jgi:glycosyltransferase involved in cell wall biosynthesis